MVLFDLGTIAGLVLLFGYVLYLYFDFRYDTIEPNPTTWFMFAYGTAILTVLEWDSDATLSMLILPMLCSIGGIVVALRLWHKAYRKNPHEWWPRDWWPEDVWERWSFIGDLAITVCYVGVWVLAYSSLVTDSERTWLVLTFLFLSNLSTFPQFYPILASTWRRPESEHWLPWAVWTLSYALLGIATFEAVDGEVMHPLMFYPLSNAVLHGLVGLFALRRAQPSARVA